MRKWLVAKIQHMKRHYGYWGVCVETVGDAVSDDGVSGTRKFAIVRSEARDLEAFKDGAY